MSPAHTGRPPVPAATDRAPEVPVPDSVPAPASTVPLFRRAFDDLELGLAFRTPARRVLQSEVDAFAALTGDHQPIHVDEAHAAAGPFGRRVAHGLLVVSVAVGMLPLEAERLLALRRVRETTFKRPVPSGEAVTVEVEIDALKPMGEEAGLVGLRGAIRLADAERLAIRFGLDVLWARAPAPGAAADASAADRGRELPAPEGRRSGATPTALGEGTARSVVAPALAASPGLAPGLAVPF